MRYLEKIAIKAYNQCPHNVRRSIASLCKIKGKHLYEYWRWLKSGAPVPPPESVKQKIVLEFARKMKAEVFVETGTYLGNMVEAVEGDFAEVYSIELGKLLFQQAVNKFHGLKHINLLNGDSGEVLPSVLDKIRNKSVVFWLDGHYSSGITEKGRIETPIREEVVHISRYSPKKYAILIDDARDFTGRHDYPKLEEFTVYLEKLFPFHSVKVKDDIIRIMP